jgi:hypothetical protein
MFLNTEGVTRTKQGVDENFSRKTSREETIWDNWMKMVILTRVVDSNGVDWNKVAQGRV